jgi:hypothetical protein
MTYMSKLVLELAIAMGQTMSGALDDCRPVGSFAEIRTLLAGLALELPRSSISETNRKSTTGLSEPESIQSVHHSRVIVLKGTPRMALTNCALRMSLGVYSAGTDNKSFGSRTNEVEGITGDQR